MSVYGFACRLGFLLLLFVAFVISEGCGFHTEYRQSFPYGDRIEGRRHHEKIVLPEIAIHVDARNAVRLWEYGTFFFPFFPVSLDTEPRKPPRPFKVMVGFLPKESGFTFNPKDTHLRVDGNVEMNPVEILTLPHSSDTKEKELARKRAHEGFVACGPWLMGSKFQVIDDRHTELKDVGLWHCFVLAFDTDPPDPGSRFQIAVRGLEKDKKPYQVPDFNFREVQYTKVDSAP